MTRMSLPTPTLHVARLRLPPFDDADANDRFALTSDAIDATVVLLAAAGDRILTSDLALAALPGTALGHLGEPSAASPAAWAAAIPAVKLHEPATGAALLRSPGRLPKPDVFRTDEVVVL
jgi:hypothetical protein